MFTKVSETQVIITKNRKWYPEIVGNENDVIQISKIFQTIKHQKKVIKCLWLCKGKNVNQKYDGNKRVWHAWKYY